MRHFQASSSSKESTFSVLIWTTRTSPCLVPELSSGEYPTPSFSRLLPHVYHNMEQAPEVWTLVCTGRAKWAWSILWEQNPPCVSDLKASEVGRGLSLSSPFNLLPWGTCASMERFYSNASKQKAVCSISISLENGKRKTFQSCN